MGPDALLEISELFYSIQGESSYAGYPCFFIRLAGCNLRCSYCDTRYAYEEEPRSCTVSRIFQELDQYPGVLVEVTGGEPLLQQGVYPLFDRLLAAGRTVLLETNGSVSLENVPGKVIRILDVKCPDSLMHEKMDFGNFRYIGRQDEVKFVISSRRDYDWATGIVNSHDLPSMTTVTFSPAVDSLSPSSLADWILADRLAVRLRLQLHPLLWPEKKRGF